VTSLALLAAAMFVAAAADQPPTAAGSPPAAIVEPSALRTVPALPDRPMIPTATIDSTLEVHGQVLKAQDLMSRMLVRVKVNDRGSYLFIVDSGADRSVIGSNLAERLGLPAGKPATLQSLAGPKRVQTVMVDRLGLGDTEVSGINAPALSETSLGADGLIGIDALSGQRLMLDFAKNTITIQDGRIAAAASADEIVVTARRRKGQLILTQGTIDGDSVYAVIDTGAQVTIGNLALRNKIFRGKRLPTPQPITLISVTGQPVHADLYIVPEMRLGGLIVRQMQIAFADVPPFALFGLAKDPAMLLGTDLLKNFSKISMDFRRRRVRFRLREKDLTALD
jgi:predicted aspartyl protease